jgi:LPXTG-motif cell wall-anchored protein
VADAASSSKSCRGQAPVVAQNSRVVSLGGNGIAIPAPGCANGTPDTDAGILPPVLPIICNAEEVAGAAAVRDALDVFALQVGTNALLKESTAGPESLSVAPAAAEAGTQCSDGKDNDGDGKIDIADPGCHTDGNAANAGSFDATDDDESNAATDGSGKSKRKRKGNGNAASLHPNDDFEGGGAVSANAGALPFTGTDVIGLSLAGLLALAGGLVLRRREDVRTVR